jgi:hypothetical protein
MSVIYQLDAIPEKIQLEMDASYTLTIIHCYKSGTRNAPKLYD